MNGSQCTLKELQKNTNNFHDLCSTTNVNYSMLGTNNIISKDSHTKICVDAISGNGVSGYQGSLCLTTNKSFNVDNPEAAINVNSTDDSNIRSVNLLQSQYVAIYVSFYKQYREITYNAIWLE